MTDNAVQHYQRLEGLLEGKEDVLLGDIAFTPDNFIGKGGMASIYDVGIHGAAKVTVITDEPMPEVIPYGVSRLHIDYLGDGNVYIEQLAKDGMPIAVPWEVQLEQSEVLKLHMMVSESEYLKKLDGKHGVVRHLGRQFVGIDGHLAGVMYMEKVAGESLRAKLIKGISPELLPGVFYQLSVTQGYLADENIVHADFKPDNVLLTDDGKVHVLDFGIAQKVGSHDQADYTMDDVPLLLNERVREEGMIAGSLGYTAPEQVRGEILTPQADIFVLGLDFYEAITGRNPADIIGNVEAGNLAPIGSRQVRKLMKGINAKVTSGDTRAAVRQLFELDPERRLDVHFRDEMRRYAGKLEPYEVAPKIPLFGPPPVNTNPGHKGKLTL